MKNMIGVSATDQKLVDEVGKESRIMPKHLMRILWEDNLRGIPLILEHDYNYLIGWSINYGIHIEPYLTRLLTITEIVETQNEQAELAKTFNSYYQFRIDRKKVEFKRLKELIDKNFIGTEIPYDQDCICYFRKDIAREVFPSLYNKEDRYGLIKINELDPIGLGLYKKGDLSVFAHRFFRRSNTIFNSLNMPFLYQLSLIDHKENDVRIRLDPDLVGLASSYGQSHERTYWWGPYFSNDLDSITPGETVYGIGERKSFNSLIRTDFRWKNKKSYNEFEAEELYNNPPAIRPIFDNTDYYGCRYVHSIIQNQSKKVHFDGAVRLYTERELHERILKKLSKSGHKTNYFKLWRIDGELEIDFWKRLLSDYFRDNYLVGEYLGGKDPLLESKTAEFKEKKDNEFNPGIQILISLHNWSYKSSEKIFFVSTPNIEDKVPSDFKELIDEEGINLDIPTFFNIVSNYFETVKLPLIIYNRIELKENLEKTIEVIKEFVKILEEQTKVKKFEYNLGFPIEKNEIRISILGDLQDISKWINNDISMPKIVLEDFYDWINKITQYFETEYSDPQKNSDIFKIINRSGII